MSKFAQLWYWRPYKLNETWWKVESFVATDHPSSTTVFTEERPTQASAFSWSSLDDEGNLVIGMTHEHLPDTPDIWWLLIDEPHPITPTLALIGFNSKLYQDGTILTKQTTPPNIKQQQQIAAIRWGKHNPKLEQLYVTETQRRKRISTKMIHTADLINEAGNYGGYIYGGAELTPDGQTIATAWQGSQRLQPQHTHINPGASDHPSA